MVCGEGAEGPLLHFGDGSSQGAETVTAAGSAICLLGLTLPQSSWARFISSFTTLELYETHPVLQLSTVFLWLGV